MVNEPPNDRLEQAMRNLERAQANLAPKLAAFEEHCRAMDRERAKLDRESAERFARILACLGRIDALLLQNEQLLKALPDAIGEKLASDVPVIVEKAS
jgi:hypothetical protein